MMTSACCLHNFAIKSRVRNFESHMQIGNRCTPWKLSSCAENHVLQALQFR
jgi:hypothetical protein